MDNLDGGIDRISELPDSILHHILSLRTTKDAGRTSVLSKRWRYLWVSVPTLYFNQEQFPVNFQEHVDTVLLLRQDESNILQYRLVISDHMDHAVLRRWLQYATKRNVHELDFELLATCEFDCCWTVPHCLLTCQSLQKLKLALPRWQLVLGDSVDLSRLTTMHLKGVISSSNSLSRLVSSCPLLEELCLEDCNFKVLTISANELKRLTIARCIFDTFNRIEICTPKLLSLNYSSGKAQGCYLHDISTLVDASLMLFNLEYSGLQSSKRWSIDETLRGLSSVKSLTLTYLGAKHLSLEGHLLGRLPMFHNMKYLKLNLVLTGAHLQAISYMLTHMPNLDTLVIRNEVFSLRPMREEKISCWTSANHGIRQIELQNFESNEQERQFISVLKTALTCNEASSSLCLITERGIGESISPALTRGNGTGASTSLALACGGTGASTSHAFTIGRDSQPSTNLAFPVDSEPSTNLSPSPFPSPSMGRDSEPSTDIALSMGRDGEPSTSLALTMERRVGTPLLP
ncbi:F-box/LRR-repeat protein At4g14103 isoform X1 [Phoenix dactylifera]|uniref:F-box/LRR-repeat protein At4g14103 isoform X1 n=1 Tax=Phoenix dactylifera TaxID=42345 RepID=A0A8B8J6U3_PHODC|nr:F-box/LRR-repeat protein At4g14103 isoform X1 [Phoenix dactylifera]XP_017699370.2 F-box/LRR-repeat protein At4g14103 isoform X1 [Phoenix dactylifera]XP_026662158.2 F-box/LRR-repeat protein At4g14103 isoform X1 [Phoenix dactylifera]